MRNKAKIHLNKIIVLQYVGSEIAEVLLQLWSTNLNSDFSQRNHRTRGLSKVGES